MIKIFYYSNTHRVLAAYEGNRMIEAVYGMGKRAFKIIKREFRQDGYRPFPISAEECRIRFPQYIAD